MMLWAEFPVQETARCILAPSSFAHSAGPAGRSCRALQGFGWNECVRHVQFRPPAATVFVKIGEHLVHGPEFGAIERLSRREVTSPQTLADFGEKRASAKAIPAARRLRRPEALRDRLHQDPEDLDSSLLARAPGGWITAFFIISIYGGVTIVQPSPLSCAQNHLLHPDIDSMIREMSYETPGGTV